MSEQARNEYFPRDVVEMHNERRTLEGTGVGSAVGLTAGAGGVAGGVLGALVGTGLSKERAEIDRTTIEEGGIVLVARPLDDAEAKKLESEWKDVGGAEVFRSPAG